MLCGQPLRGPIFATSGIFLPLNDPLACYCDAGMHWDCYAVWEHREGFAKAHVRFWIENEKRNPYWARVFENERCFIVIGPHPPVAQAHVMLFATGSRIDVPLQGFLLQCLTSSPVLSLPLLCDEVHRLELMESTHQKASRMCFGVASL